MNALELAEAEGWTLVTPGDSTARISAAYTSDLLSDVMAHAPAVSVLITIQGHRNTVAVASLADIRAIVLCHNRPAPEDMRAAAVQERIAIIQTSLDQFAASLRVARRLGL